MFSGFGGLGQMGVMIAKAMGNNVTVISTSNSKEAMAKKLGADNYIISTNPDSMKAGFKTLDLILSTISATHEVMPYLNLLKIKGTLVVLGAVAVPFKVQFLSKCDELASRTSKDLNSCPSFFLALPQNLDKNQNLDKQINSFHMQTLFFFEKCKQFPKNPKENLKEIQKKYPKK